MKSHVLKSKCDVFALHCVTKLLFAFIWDQIVRQIHRVQRPIDVRNIPFHEAKSGHKLVSTGQKQTKRISNKT